MSDAVQDLLDEMYFGLPGQLEHAHERPLFHRKTLHDAQAAHKANLATIESLESHNAKLVESRQLMSTQRDAALAENEQLKAKLASGQCVDLLCGILADSSGLPSSAGRKVVPHE